MLKRRVMMAAAALLLSTLATGAAGCRGTCAGADRGVPAPPPRSAYGAATQPSADLFVHEPTSAYARLHFHGFEVLVSSAARAHPASTQAALDLLEVKLGEIAELLPRPALGRLRAVRFWVEHHNPAHECACYHPNADWLAQHGYNPDKFRAIEIAHPDNFVEWTHRDQPQMVLHELAHAYHDTVLGFDNHLVADCYEHAVQSGDYESVRHVSGEVRRHYALNNAREYFAELTEAYFGRNDFYPFTRAELARHDPDGYEMVVRAWGLRGG
ncbi:MAG: hypothetical protein KKB50_21375 [Planctomycetes bacterium]|nr:hypothetical protein [Planctomycetota bacterium]